MDIKSYINLERLREQVLVLNPKLKDSPEQLTLVNRRLEEQLIQSEAVVRIEEVDVAMMISSFHTMAGNIVQKIHHLKNMINITCNKEEKIKKSGNRKPNIKRSMKVEEFLSDTSDDEALTLKRSRSTTSRDSSSVRTVNQTDENNYLGGYSSSVADGMESVPLSLGRTPRKRKRSSNCKYDYLSPVHKRGISGVEHYKSKNSKYHKRENAVVSTSGICHPCEEDIIVEEGVTSRSFHIKIPSLFSIGAHELNLSELNISRKMFDIRAQETKRKFLQIENKSTPQKKRKSHKQRENVPTESSTANSYHQEKDDAIISQLLNDVIGTTGNEGETWQATNVLENINNEIIDNYDFMPGHNLTTSELPNFENQKVPKRRYNKVSKSQTNEEIKKTVRKSKSKISSKSQPPTKSNLAQYVENFSNDCEMMRGSTTPAGSSTMSQPLVSSTTQNFELIDQQQSNPVMYYVDGNWVNGQLISSNVLPIDAAQFNSGEIGIAGTFQGTDFNENINWPIITQLRQFQQNTPVINIQIPPLPVTTTTEETCITAPPPAHSTSGVLDLSIKSNLNILDTSSNATSYHQQNVGEDYEMPIEVYDNEDTPLDLSVNSISNPNAFITSVTERNGVVESESQCIVVDNGQDDDFIRRLIETSDFDLGLDELRVENDENKSFKAALDMPLLDTAVDEENCVLNGSASTLPLDSNYVTMNEDSSNYLSYSFGEDYQFTDQSSKEIFNHLLEIDNTTTTTNNIQDREDENIAKISEMYLFHSKSSTQDEARENAYDDNKKKEHYRELTYSDETVSLIESTTNADHVDAQVKLNKNQLAIVKWVPTLPKQLNDAAGVNCTSFINPNTVLIVTEQGVIYTDKSGGPQLTNNGDLNDESNDKEAKTLETPNQQKVLKLSEGENKYKNDCKEQTYIQEVMHTDDVIYHNQPGNETLPSTNKEMGTDIICIDHEQTDISKVWKNIDGLQTKINKISSDIKTGLNFTFDNGIEEGCKNANYKNENEADNEEVKDIDGTENINEIQQPNEAQCIEDAFTTGRNNSETYRNDIISNEYQIINICEKNQTNKGTDYENIINENIIKNLNGDDNTNQEKVVFSMVKVKLSDEPTNLDYVFMSDGEEISRCNIENTLDEKKIQLQPNDLSMIKENNEVEFSPSLNLMKEIYDKPREMGECNKAKPNCIISDIKAYENAKSNVDPQEVNPITNIGTEGKNLSICVEYGCEVDSAGDGPKTLCHSENDDNTNLDVTKNIRSELHMSLLEMESKLDENTLNFEDDDDLDALILDTSSSCFDSPNEDRFKDFPVNENSEQVNDIDPLALNEVINTTINTTNKEIPKRPVCIADNIKVDVPKLPSVDSIIKTSPSSTGGLISFKIPKLNIYAKGNQTMQGRGQENSKIICTNIPNIYDIKMQPYVKLTRITVKEGCRINVKDFNAIIKTSSNSIINTSSKKLNTITRTIKNEATAAIKIDVPQQPLESSSKFQSTFRNISQIVKNEEQQFFTTILQKDFKCNGAASEAGLLQQQQPLTIQPVFKCTFKNISAIQKLKAGHVGFDDAEKTEQNNLQREFRNSLKTNSCVISKEQDGPISANPDAGHREITRQACAQTGIQEIINIFGVTCLPHLVNGCLAPNYCQKCHQYNGNNVVFDILNTMNRTQLYIAYSFMYNHYNLFRRYFLEFCNIFLLHKDRNTLYYMINDCERYPELAEYLIVIYDSLIKSGLSPLNACRQVLKRIREKSTPIIDALVAIIMKSDWTIFSDHIESYTQEVYNYNFRIGILEQMAPAVLNNAKQQMHLKNIFFKCVQTLHCDDVPSLCACSPSMMQCLALMATTESTEH